IRGERGAQRGIDAAGKAEHDALEAVLVDVVAQAHHAGGVIGPIQLFGRGHRPLLAAPLPVNAKPVRRHDRFLEFMQLEADRAVGIHRKRSTVKYEFILAADLIQINERQTAFDDAIERDVETLLGLATPIRRAIRHEQDFAARLRYALHHVRSPDILANRDTDSDAVDDYRAG